jgi:malate dehydrogenase
VRNVIIWGNHSSTQFPDAKHAKVLKGKNSHNVHKLKSYSFNYMYRFMMVPFFLTDGKEIDAYAAVNDSSWLQDQFITVS